MLISIVLSSIIMHASATEQRFGPYLFSTIPTVQDITLEHYEDSLYDEEVQYLEQSQNKSSREIKEEYDIELDRSWKEQQRNNLVGNGVEFVPAQPSIYERFVHTAAGEGQTTSTTTPQAGTVTEELPLGTTSPVVQSTASAATTNANMGFSQTTRQSDDTTTIDYPVTAVPPQSIQSIQKDEPVHIGEERTLMADIQSDVKILRRDLALVKKLMASFLLKTYQATDTRTRKTLKPLRSNSTDKDKTSLGLKSSSEEGKNTTALKYRDTTSTMPHAFWRRFRNKHRPPKNRIGYKK